MTGTMFKFWNVKMHKVKGISDKNYRIINYEYQQSTEKTTASASHSHTCKLMPHNT